MTSVVNQNEQTWNYTPLPEPIPITEQVWPEGTKPLVCTRHMTYNHENYIRECIEGVLMQKTTFPVRVCIHDDASTDKTAEIVREYQEKYPNLIWAYCQKENSFRSPNKSEMRKEFASWFEEGKYIAICDGDDYWIDSLKLQKQIRVLEDNNYWCCFHEADVIDMNQVIKKEHVRHSGYSCDYFDALQGSFGGRSSTSVHRITYTSIPAEFTKGSKVGDYHRNVMLSLQAQAYTLPDVMAVYRHHSGGITKNTNRLDYYYSRMGLFTFLETYLEDTEKIAFLQEFRVRWVYAKLLFIIRSGNWHLFSKNLKLLRKVKKMRTLKYEKVNLESRFYDKWNYSKKLRLSFRDYMVGLKYFFTKKSYIKEDPLFDKNHHQILKYYM